MNAEKIKAIKQEREEMLIELNKATGPEKEFLNAYIEKLDRELFFLTNHA